MSLDGKTTTDTVTTDTTLVTPSESTTLTPIQLDIQKLEAKITSLEEDAKADGTELYEDAIQVLRDERDVLVAKIEAEENSIKTKEATWADNFRTKHGVSWHVALVGIAFVVWQVTEAVMNLFK